MMKMRVWAAAGLCVAGMMGCGDDGGGGGVTVSSFPKELTAIYCAKTFDCCTAEEIAQENSLFSFTTEDECNTVLGGLFVGVYPKQADVDAGKVEFDAAAAKAALEQAQGASCAEVFGEDDFLEGAGPKIYKGKVADGEACTSNVVCATPGASCTNSKCKAPPKVGTACPSFFDCDTDADDLYCGADQTCAARVALGAACEEDDACLSGACVESECVNKQDTGAACDSGDDCKYASCGFETKTCEGPKSAGEECFDDEECLSGTCAMEGGERVCASGGPRCDGL